MVLRSRKRRLASALRVEAAAWPDAAAARAAAATGVKMTRVGGFRAQARSPHVVELSWNPPLDAVEEILVYRSPTRFATAPEPGDGSWSSPAWAWAATPSVPLQSTIMGGMRTLKQGNLDW